MRAADLSPAVPRSRPGPRGPQPSRRYGSEWQRGARYRPRGAHQSHDRDCYIKKTAALQHSNLALAFPRSRVGAARVRPPCAAELDEMWSFVGAKESARCLWHALDVLSQSLCTILYGEKFEREKYYSL